jgi:hypothetical protein
MMRSSLPTSHGFVPLPNAYTKKDIHNPMPSSSTANAFTLQFEYTGTIDTGPPLCIPAALKFRDDVCGGEDKIRKYCVELAERGERLLCDILSTEALHVSERNRVNFANVRLPLDVASNTNHTKRFPSNSFVVAAEHVPAVTTYFNTKLVQEFNTYIAICLWDGSLWARFSAEIYLDLEDFEYGGRVLKQLCDRVKQGEYLQKKTE